MPDPLDPRPLFNVDGRVIVLTGGTGGLGSATARGLAACGAQLVIVARSKEGVDAVVADIHSAGGDTPGGPCRLHSAGDALPGR